MRIGELAAAAGISRDTIRFYERVGLLDGRRLPNGYRDFPPETVDWLAYVRTARRLGFTLAEIAVHGSGLRDADDSAAALSALIEDKLRLIDERMADLAELRTDLAARVGADCPLRPDPRSGGVSGSPGAAGWPSRHRRE
ncbi:MerR family transcriptional regulator [Actinocatenispora rupis]|uniref:MerR family transcriptional regulator n=1 Tax=Actinocatenispora rupis TaxID=519421 RepID=A0A8J3JE67_9ACTN|nr:MerR family transcriptional regulator [Actinocatenispora rupis]GID15069.1 MerR family transcriptional regulator [Actinocatenispora rupis]